MVNLAAKRDLRICLGTVGALALFAVPKAAQAEVGYLTPGIIMSFMGGPAKAIGFGGELSFMGYPTSPPEGIGFGAFFQGQAYHADHPRLAVGFQAGSLVGVEVGAAWRGGDATHVSTSGAHLGLYGSIGVFVVGVRGTVPVYSPKAPDKEPQGGEIGLVLQLKWPIKIYGAPRDWFRVPHGRPLRVGDELHLAAPDVGKPWAEGAEPLVAGLDPDTRRALAEAWLRSALDEHAAIAAFAQLALSLLAAGAPADLLSRAQQAALEEVEHARLCFALASAYLGAPVGPGPLDTGPVQHHDLESLATESWRDGCLGEGSAAALARAARRRAHDPAVCAALTVISRDEAAHAELGWDIVSWCLAQGGRPVVDALCQAVSRTPKGFDAPPEDDGPALAALLAEHGQLSRADHARCVAEAVRTAVRRAGWLLAPGGADCRAS